jgi:putative oxygen-independent coproporphyrinogen III oxidase
MKPNTRHFGRQRNARPNSSAMRTFFSSSPPTSLEPQTPVGVPLAAETAFHGSADAPSAGMPDLAAERAAGAGAGAPPAETAAPRPARDETLGIYVHFPWCLSKCPYCDFVVVAAPRVSIDGERYAEAILAELAARKNGLGARKVTSIFFGGGTPSLWGPREIRRVIDAITTSLSPGGDVEVSLECDPSSLDEDIARKLVDAGIQRLSIGVQSLDDERLRFLGRIHTREDAIAAVGAAIRARVPRVSTDLMYAVAGQSAEDAAREARVLADLGATHVSAYSLTIESGTPFGKLARRGRLPLCEDAVMADSFFAIDDALTAFGFRHYEVSNYSKSGQESRHNLGYWRGRDYLGLGCGAYGTLRSDAGALRYRNHVTPRAYFAAAESASLAKDGRALHASEEPLDPLTLLRERIMLGLRTQEGIDLDAIGTDIGIDPMTLERMRAIADLEARGRVVRQGARIAVPRDAWIWADDTAATLF